jgi:hypothetical protein
MDYFSKFSFVYYYFECHVFLFNIKFLKFTILGIYWLFLLNALNCRSFIFYLRMELYRFNHSAKTDIFDGLYDALNEFRIHVQKKIIHKVTCDESGQLESYLAAELESLNKYLQRDNLDTIRFKKEGCF